MIAAVVALALYVRHQLGSVAPPRLERPQQVSLLDELAPPPPPKQELTEPEASTETIEGPQESPADVPDLPPAIDDSLGIEGEGAAGADAFALRAKKGGRDLLQTGDGAGDSFARFGRYAATIERSLERQLAADPELRHAPYTAVVQVWIAGDGRIDRCRIRESTGQPETDHLLAEILTTACRLPEPPPADMPQPVTLRIRARAG